MKLPGHIYLIINRVNRKGYVGQTVRSIHKRFVQHKIDARNGSDLALHCALRNANGTFAKEPIQ
jgi:hypothetical protein